MFFAEEKNNREGKRGSFARGWSIWMIICKSQSILMIICQRWLIQTIICKRPVDANDYLQEAGPSGW